MDEDLLLAWANDPVTRATSFHPEPIDARSHREWLASRLSSVSSRLLIGLDDDRPIGQVRLERDDEGTVEVGISVAPEARGRGVGRSLLDAGLAAGRDDALLKTRRFVARIRPDNAVSIALFEGAGFRLRERTECDGVPCLVYELAV